MDRKQLKLLLNAGSVTVLDVRQLYFEQGLDPLFQIAHLNNAILLKQIPHFDLRLRLSLPQTATLLYLPYNPSKPEDGGESFYYTRDTLRSSLGRGVANADAGTLIADLALLDALDRIPSFSAWLVHNALQRAEIDIPAGYFAIGEKEAALIEQRMRARLRPLVAMAFASKGVNDTSIERLVNLLWKLKALDELAPLMSTFKIGQSEASDLFFCWFGLAFFENEYLKLQPRLKDMAAWMATKSRPRDVLHRDVLDHHMHTVQVVRRRLQTSWKTALAILQAYTSTYEELVAAGGCVARFIEFLQQSHTHFWALGASLGRLEQSHAVWAQLCGPQRDQPMTFSASTELFGALAQINPAIDAIGQMSNALAASA